MFTITASVDLEGQMRLQVDCIMGQIVPTSGRPRTPIDRV